RPTDRCTHRAGAAHLTLGSHWSYQPRDRRPIVPQSPHDRSPPPQHLPQAEHHIPAADQERPASLSRRTCLSTVLTPVADTCDRLPCRRTDLRSEVDYSPRFGWRLAKSQTIALASGPARSVKRPLPVGPGHTCPISWTRYDSTSDAPSGVVTVVCV